MKFDIQNKIPVMNKHILIDNLTANIGSLISGKMKFFVGSTDSQSFKELISSTALSAPEITSEGTYEIRAANKSVGDLDPAFRVEKWIGDDYPSIIYHHGNNESPFDYRKRAKNSFMNIFVKDRDKFEANLIVVRALFSSFYNLEKMNTEESIRLVRGNQNKLLLSEKQFQKMATPIPGYLRSDNDSRAK